MRVKHLNMNTFDETRKSIADFFGLTYEEVHPHQVAGGYAIYINENKNAQEVYKTINPYGNSSRPGLYDFTQENLISWDPDKQTAKVLF